MGQRDQREGDAMRCRYSLFGEMKRIGPIKVALSLLSVLLLGHCGGAQPSGTAPGEAPPVAPEEPVSLEPAEAVSVKPIKEAYQAYFPVGVAVGGAGGK